MCYLEGQGDLVGISKDGVELFFHMDCTAFLGTPRDI